MPYGDGPPCPGCMAAQQKPVVLQQEPAGVEKPLDPAAEAPVEEPDAPKPLKQTAYMRTGPWQPNGAMEPQRR